MRIRENHFAALSAIIGGNYSEKFRSEAEQLVGWRYARRLANGAYEVLPNGLKVLSEHNEEMAECRKKENTLAIAP